MKVALMLGVPVVLFLGAVLSIVTLVAVAVELDKPPAKVVPSPQPLAPVPPVPPTPAPQPTPTPEPCPGPGPCPAPRPPR